MSETLMLPVAFIAGAGLGGMFFGGLWWTLRRAMTTKHPGLWFIFSMLARTSLTLVGFYLVSAGHWQRMAACLVGFLVARMVITRLTKPSAPRPAPEVRHAPQP
jgi:F1F0 ATPase subunit 2